MKEIKILGPGCAKCKELFEQTTKAAEEINLECKIEKVEDINEIMSYGVMFTPALVVDGKVLLSGSSSSIKELVKLIE